MSDGTHDKSSQLSRRVGDDITVGIGVSLDVWLPRDGMYAPHEKRLAGISVWATERP